ncbi:MAG: TIGR00730 family Rossman fold protein [Verrucomicrobiota bacterium]
MKKICVYCGSSNQVDAIYKAEAQKVGHLLADNGITLIYGGGNVGLMGELARAALSHQGQVIGIIPQALMDIELGLMEVTELIVVESMHERKSRMAELADGFIVLPGGIGTLEEFFEIFTWAQLGLHEKPIRVLNTNNYYEDLLKFLDKMSREKFLGQEHLAKIDICLSSEKLLPLLTFANE